MNVLLKRLERINIFPKIIEIEFPHRFFLKIAVIAVEGHKYANNLLLKSNGI